MTDFWESFHGIFIWSQTRNLLRASRRRNISLWRLSWVMNPGLTSNKSTHYLLDYGDYGVFCLFWSGNKFIFVWNTFLNLKMKTWDFQLLLNFYVNYVIYSLNDVIVEKQFWDSLSWQFYVLSRVFARRKLGVSQEYTYFVLL